MNGGFKTVTRMYISNIPLFTVVLKSFLVEYSEEKKKFRKIQFPTSYY